MTKDYSDNPNLIQCSDDGWAPWSIVCVHLLFGKSTEWLTLESDNPEVDYDWLCPECMDKFQREGDAGEDHDITDLRPVCIHCVEKVRLVHDPNFSNNLE